MQFCSNRPGKHLDLEQTKFSPKASSLCGETVPHSRCKLIVRYQRGSRVIDVWVPRDNPRPKVGHGGGFCDASNDIAIDLASVAR